MARHVCDRIVATGRHLHAHSIVHADLRTEHFFLIDSQWKLADLSDARRRGEPLREHLGARPIKYLTPELARNVRRRMRGGESPQPIAAMPSTDAWALGVLTYELCVGGAPLWPHPDSEILENLAGETEVTLGLGAIPSAAARGFIRKLVRWAPDERMTLDEAAAHAWLSGGLDEVELGESFGGLLKEQQATESALASVEAEVTAGRRRDVESAPRGNQILGVRAPNAHEARAQGAGLYGAAITARGGV